MNFEELEVENTATELDRVAEMFDRALPTLASDPPKGLQESRRALDALATISDSDPRRRSLELDIRATRAQLLTNTQALDEAWREVHLALDLLDERATPYERARTIAVLGRVHEVRGDLESAGEAFRRALAAMDPTDGGRSALRSELESGLGRMHFVSSEYPIALDWFRRAQRTAAAGGVASSEAMALMNQGNVLSQIGDFEGSLRAYEQSLSIQRRERFHHDLVLSLSNLAVVYERLEESDKALSTLDECLAVPCQWSSPEYRQFALVTKTRILLELGRLEEALAVGVELRETLEDVVDPSKLALAHLALGDLHRDTGDLEAALNDYAQCLCGLSENPSFTTESDCRLGLAVAYQRMGRADEAIVVVESLREKAEETEDPTVLASVLMAASELYEAVGNDSQALEALRAYVALERAVRGQERARHIANLEAIHEIEAAHHREELLEEARRELEERVERRTRQLNDALLEARELQAQLRQSQKLEAIGRLAGGVAHDFNNLLTIIRGYSDLLLARMSETSVHRESMQQIVGATDRAANLTSQLLALSRRQPLELEVVNVNERLRELERMVRRLVLDNVELRTDWAAESDSAILTDPGQVDQLVLNLVVNSLDAMPEGGVLTVSTETRTIESDATLPAGRYTLICVEDTGCGMSDEVLELAFEPFFTTKDVGQGTGLGLSSVYGIARQAGGEVRVRSAVGVGTRIETFLPVFDGPIKPAAVATLRPSRQVRGRTIMVVEDEPEIRELQRASLVKMGHRVLSAGNGEEALSLGRLHRGEIDVVVTDVVMPVLGGVKLWEELRRELPELKFLFTSGYPQSAGGLPAGVKLIAKPFRMQELCSAVEALFD